LKTGVGMFLLSLGFTVPVSPDECREAGEFLINFTKIYPEDEVIRHFFAWLKESMSPVLIRWGITSRTVSEWEEKDKEQFYRFLIAWGYALYKHPNGRIKIPKYIVDVMKEKDLERW